MVGISNINNRVRDINFVGSRVDLSEGSIDAQKSEPSNILIVVNGEIVLPGKSARPFVQTFLLAGQGGGTSFYCRNSILRVLPAPAPVIIQSAPQPVVAPVVPQFQSAAPVPVAAPTPTSAPVATVQAELQKMHVEPVRAAPAPAPVPVPVPEPVVEEPKGPQSWADRLKSASATDVAPKTTTGVKVVRSVPKPAPVPTKPEGSSSNGKPSDNGAKPAAKVVPAIYVRNVAADSTKEELQAVFGTFGAVKRIDIVADKGMAFLDFDSDDIVKAILAHTTATPIEFKGATLKVEERKPSQPKKAGDGKPSSGRDSGRDGGRPRGDKPSGDKPRGDKSASRPPRASKPAQE